MYKYNEARALRRDMCVMLRNNLLYFLVDVNMSFRFTKFDLLLKSVSMVKVCAIRHKYHTYTQLVTYIYWLEANACRGANFEPLLS